MSDVSIKHLDGETLAKAMISGIHAVMSEQELLNRINVFPVADSDTGTNLSLSLGSALPLLQAENTPPLGALLAGLADALLDGARGNSGAIVAQFFQGMSDSAGEISRFTTYTFGKAVAMGSDYAHDALSKPREGTILSVVAAFSDSAQHQASSKPERDFAELIHVARLHADEALADTPNQLDVLRKAGVVDAGAKGFVELIGGMDSFIREGRMIPRPDSAPALTAEAPLPFSATDNASQFRYCTECLIAAPDIDRRKLREALSRLGDSVVLAGSKRKAKIHIHVDSPEAVFELARQFGELSGEKADDMHRQQSATHRDARSFAVITDSGADISDDDLERLDIHMVPCRIQFGDRGYLDKVSISTDEFYSELKSNPHHPTSSQPAPGDFRRQFQFLTSHFSDVVCITLTSRASGTYEGAQSAAKRSSAPDRIHVVDSLNASVGQGQLAVMAAECAEAGMGVDETIALLRLQVPNIRTYALLNDLKYAVRGGRLPRWVKVVADLVRIVPIISVKPDGRIGLGGGFFGRRNRVRKFANFVASQIDDGQTVDIRIGQAVCPDDADEFAALLQSRVNSIAELKICKMGTGIGVHGGPGTLIVSTRPVPLGDNVASGID